MCMSHLDIITFHICSSKRLKSNKLCRLPPQQPLDGKHVSGTRIPSSVPNLFFSGSLNVTLPHLSLPLCFFFSFYLFLDGHFHLNPFGVWLCPQEASIYETHLWEETCCSIHEVAEAWISIEYPHVPCKYCGEHGAHHYDKSETWDGHIIIYNQWQKT